MYRSYRSRGSLFYCENTKGFKLYKNFIILFVSVSGCDIKRWLLCCGLRLEYFNRVHFLSDNWWQHYHSGLRDTFYTRTLVDPVVVKDLVLGTSTPGRSKQNSSGGPLRLRTDLNFWRTVKKSSGVFIFVSVVWTEVSTGKTALVKVFVENETLMPWEGHSSSCFFLQFLD